MKLRTLTFGLLAAGLLLAGCSLAEDITPPPDATSISAGPTVQAAAGPADGAAIYAEHCAACHGLTGRGDGTLAAQLMTQQTTPLPDFTAPAWVSAFDANAAYQVVTNGRLDQLMPPWKDKLSDAERWAVVNYLGTLGQTTAGVAAGAPTTTAAGDGQVSGQVSNASLGGTVPAELVITLHGYDDFAEVETLTTTSQADGRFMIQGIAVVSGRQYMLTTAHADLSYSSNLFTLDNGTQVAGVQLPIFDRTTDLAVVQVARLQITLAARPGTTRLQVDEVIVLTNNSDKVFAPETGPVFTVTLPPGATGIRVTNQRDGLDLQTTAQGVALNSPLWPGAQAAQIGLSFELPAASPLSFEQPLAYPLAALAVWVPEQVSVQGAQLQDQGLQTQTATTNRVYSAEGGVAGPTIAFTVVGLAGTGTAAVPVAANNYWLIGLAGLGVFLAGATLGWFYRRPS